MLQLLNSLIEEKTLLGVEVKILSGEEHQISYCLLEKRSGKILKAESNTAASLESFFGEIREKKIKKGTPAVLCIHGKGILHKKVDAGETDKTARALPGADTDDFYFQEYSGEDHSYISFVRKESIDDLLGRFSREEVPVVELLLGPFAFQAVLPFLYVLNTEKVFISGFELQLKSRKIANAAPSAGESHLSFTLGGETIPADIILAYAAGFNHFLPSPDLVPAVSERIAAVKKETRTRKILNTAFFGMIGFFFFVLLGNYLLFDHFYKSQAELAGRLEQHSQEFAMLEDLQNKLKDQKSFYEKYDLLEKPHISYYSDQIAKDLPMEIRLTSLHVNELKKKQSNDSLLAFRHNMISIGGRCEKATEFNSWLSKLRKKGWVGKVDILAYGQSVKEEQAEFTIEIEIK